MEIADAIDKLTEAVEKIPASQEFLYLSIVANVTIILVAGLVFFQHWNFGNRDRKVRAHERIAQWNDPEFSDRRKGVYRYLAATSRADDVKMKRYHREAAFREAVLQCLNFFEALGQGIDDKVIHEKAARRFFSGIVVEFYDASLPVRKYLKEKSGEDALEDLGRLAKKWR